MTLETRTVAPDEAGLRLDRWFRRHFPALGHGRLEKLLRTGQVRVDGRRAKAGDRLVAGQAVRVPPAASGAAADGVPNLSERRAAGGAVEADAATLAELRARVLHRDAAVLVLDKPSGLAVQGGSGTRRHVDACLDGLRFDASERPRLVHRLDKDTSGCLVLARTAAAAAHLTAAFRTGAVHKTYWAVSVGVPQPASGRIDAPLAKLPGPAGERMVLAGEGDAGQRAVTLYRVLDQAGRRAALLCLTPVTGRTHQLRVHLAALGTPILGDGKYGGAGARLPVGGQELPRRLHLHARRLVLPHPSGGSLDVRAPLPAELATTWAWFGFDPEAEDAALAEAALDRPGSAGQTR